MSTGCVTWTKKSSYSLTWTECDICSIPIVFNYSVTQNRVSEEIYPLTSESLIVTDGDLKSIKNFWGEGPKLIITESLMSAETYYVDGSKVIVEPEISTYNEIVIDTQIIYVEEEYKSDNDYHVTGGKLIVVEVQ